MTMRKDTGIGLRQKVLSAPASPGGWRGSPIWQFGNADLPQSTKTRATLMAALALEILYCNLILKPFAVRIRPCGINTAVRLLGPPALVLAAPIRFSRLYLLCSFSYRCAGRGGSGSTPGLLELCPGSLGGKPSHDTERSEVIIAVFCGCRRLRRRRLVRD